MDTRRLLTTILIAGVIMLAFPYVMRLWTGEPKNPKTPTTIPADRPAYPDPYPTKPLANSEQNAAPVAIHLGDPSAASKDKLALTIDNTTAGIELVQLNVKDYTQNVKSKRHPVPEPLTLMRSGKDVPLAFSTLGVHVSIDGAEIPLITAPAALKGLSVEDAAARIHKDNSYAISTTQYVWKIVKQSATEVDLMMTVQNAGVPVARITKSFTIDPGDYNVVISHSVENLTDRTIKVAIDQLAATDLPLDPSQVEDRFYHAARLKTTDKTDITVEPEFYNLSHPDIQKFDASNTHLVGSFIQNATNPLEWIASSGRFFVSITRPLPETGAPPPTELWSKKTIPTATHIASASIDLLHNVPEQTDCIAGIRLTGNALAIAPRATLDLPLSVFFGPKRQGILQGSPTAAPNSHAYIYNKLQYAKVIQVTGTGCFGLYSRCGIDALAYYMLKFLDLLKNSIAFGNYGVAIIILVFMVKFALHPLTRHAQINMAVMGKKMKDLQPLIEANKKKYPKDKQKQNEEMMKIYKEKKVNPAGGLMGCLPMLFQTPIWIAVWDGLRSDIHLRHASFIPGWINDLSAPDYTVMLAHPFHIPIISSMMGPITALNILPLLLGIVVFFQMKVTAASQPKPSDPQQANMQKMSSYMVLIFPVFLYNMPSAINLYYFASTLGGLVDTYYVRKTLKRKGILPTNAKALPTQEPT